jgi:hypothetical protein
MQARAIRPCNVLLMCYFLAEQLDGMEYIKLWLSERIKSLECTRIAPILCRVLMMMRS